MTMYHFQSIAPFFVWCLLGAVAFWKNGLL